MTRRSFRSDPQRILPRSLGSLALGRGTASLLGLWGLLFACSSESLQTGASSTDPTPFREASEEQVEFLGDELVLEGTLSLPARMDDETVPALVLVHGSGPNSRDERLEGQLLMQFGFAIPVFSLLARSLTDAGFAVLRYDKRSCGQFNDCSAASYPVPPDDLTIDAFVNDVRGALDYLEQRPEVDPDRISVIGHSEGATYVPTLLQDRPRIAAGVLLAAPFSPIDVSLRNQLELARRILAESELTEAEVETALRETSRLSDQLELLRDGVFEGDQIGGIGVRFWSSLMSLGDEAPRVLNEVTQPVLLVGGDYDWNVPPTELEQWRAALVARDSDRTVMRSLGCMTHALNCINQPDYTKIRDIDISRELHPELVTTLLSILH
jgi:uncharacterized protein